MTVMARAAQVIVAASLGVVARMETAVRRGTRMVALFRQTPQVCATIRQSQALWTQPTLG
jgi:hypothetical protein